MNFFDYGFIIIVPLIFLFVTVKYVILFAKALRCKKANGHVTEIRAGKNVKDNKYIYVVTFTDASTTRTAELKGYASPFIFSTGEMIPLLIDRKDARKVFPFTVKGKVANLILKLILYVLLVLGTLSSLARLDLFRLDIALIDLVSISLVLLPFVMLINRIRLITSMLNDSCKTYGVIKGYQESLDSENSKTYLPVIEFKDINNRIILFTSGKHYYDTRTIGDKVKVIYNKSFPELAEINRVDVIWIEVIFWAITVLLALIYMWLG